MMNQKQYLFLVLALVGVLVLLYISSFTEPKLSSIISLENNSPGDSIKIQAEIKSVINPTPNFYILKLEDDTGVISGIINLNSNPANLKNKTCEIIGKLTEYENSTELSINKISSCSS